MSGLATAPERPPAPARTRVPAIVRAYGAANEGWSRAGALLQGNVKASIVDSANRKMLETKAPGKFIVLPMEGVNALVGFMQEFARKHG